MRFLNRLLATAAFVALPFAGSAAQSITSITATFANSVPTPPGTSINNSNPDAIQVCWPGAVSGDCATLGTATNLSGYRFERAATAFDPGLAPFALGTFTHFNYPISAAPPGPLTAVDLLFSFSIAGANPTVFGDSWTLSHEETDNNGPCAYPGTIDCSDRVSFALTSGGAPTPFEYNGSMYNITIFGFGATAGEAELNPAFITLEQAANETTLWAQITAVPGDSTVPEPATMTLLATGLAGLAAARRKRNKV